MNTGNVQNASAGALQDLFSSTQEDNQPIYFPRKRLNQSFAVLLLRSVYDAADAMDFVAMVGYYGRSVAEQT